MNLFFSSSFGTDSSRLFTVGPSDLTASLVTPYSTTSQTRSTSQFVTTPNKTSSVTTFLNVTTVVSKTTKVVKTTPVSR
jgi:hypothetical protein